MVRKPKHLFRSLSAKEVEAFWTILKEKADTAQHLYDRCLTDDKQGFRFLHREDAENYWGRKTCLEGVRYLFDELLAKKTKKGRSK